MIVVPAFTDSFHAMSAIFCIMLSVNLAKVCNRSLFFSAFFISSSSSAVLGLGGLVATTRAAPPTTAFLSPNSTLSGRPSSSNNSRVIFKALTGVSATIVEPQGSSRSSELSPKKSPAERPATSLSSTNTLQVPSLITKRVVPASPCLTRVSPFCQCSFAPRAARMGSSSDGKHLKSSTFCIKSSSNLSVCSGLETWSVSSAGITNALSLPLRWSPRSSGVSLTTGLNACLHCSQPMT
mmetsp:Transcript_66465/g.126643  ORF Transcript_66465/g.126643 Transcript_66465/m.126643 type:complete len:238 (+) Transcript_66465:1232-1945(+)